MDLDCLHDTRYGLLLHKWPWLISKLKISSYISRVTDQFILQIGLKKEDWDKAWADRSVDILKQTPPTIFCYQLINELQEKYMRVKLGTPLELPTLVVNTYPYRFSESEHDIYETIIREFYSDVVESIEVVYMPIDKLDFRYMVENFESVTMYDWRGWLAARIEEIKRAPNPSFVLNGPALLDLESSIQVAGSIIEDGINPFLEAKDLLKECLTLNLFDSSLFSLRPPKENSSQVP